MTVSRFPTDSDWFRYLTANSSRPATVRVRAETIAGLVAARDGFDRLCVMAGDAPAPKLSLPTGAAHFLIDRRSLGPALDRVEAALNALHDAFIRDR